MKRVLSGAAALLLGGLVAGPASADSWTDNFAQSFGQGASSRAVVGRTTASRRSNLGAMVSTDNEDRPSVRTRRSPRIASVRGEKRRATRYASYRTKTASRARSQMALATQGASGGSSGVASYYWQPQRVASGGWFNPSAMTAAHKTLPFGTKVRVTNVNSGRSTVVTINDRGPYVAGRVIDLSRAAASAVGMIASGLARVRMEILGR